ASTSIILNAAKRRGGSRSRAAFSPRDDPRARSRSFAIVREDRPGDRATWKLTLFQPPNLLDEDAVAAIVHVTGGTFRAVGGAGSSNAQRKVGYRRRKSPKCPACKSRGMEPLAGYVNGTCLTVEGGFLVQGTPG